MTQTATAPADDHSLSRSLKPRHVTMITIGGIIGAGLFVASSASIASTGPAIIVSYGLALWAFRLGATPRLAALRETSILFGVAIAVVFLKERVTGARLAGVAAIGIGAAVLLVSG